MASEIKLKNDLETEGTIYHKDGDPAYEVSIGEIYNSVNNIKDVKDFGAIGDANYKDETSGIWYSDAAKTILATDDTAAFQRAADYGAFNVSKGRYILSNTVYLPTGAYVTGDGDILVNGVTAFRCTGTTDIITSLTVDALEITDELTVDDASLLKEGDYILIKSPIKADTNTTDSGDWQLDGDDEGVYFEEFARVSYVSGNVLALTTSTTIPRYPIGSVIEKVNFKTVTINSNINIIREGHNSGGVDLKYCLNSNVSLGHSQSSIYTGQDIILERCLSCEGHDSETTLSPETVFNYISTNPGYEDYYSYNTFKAISSTDSGFRRIKTNGGTQCIDITYRGAPSIHCYLINNVSNGARSNMLTSHPNSIYTLFKNNIGIGCQRGISSRGRGDQIIDNIIQGSSRVVGRDSLTSYGIAIADGFNKGALVSGNIISKFYRGVLLNTGNNDGFSENTQTLKGGSITDCSVGATLYRPSNNTGMDLYGSCGITIDGVTFNDIGEHTIYSADEYINDLAVTNCIFPSVMDSSKYCLILFNDNCARVSFCSNTLPIEGRYVYIGNITDTLLSDGSYQDTGINIANNNYRSTSTSYKVYFGGDYVDNIALWPLVIPEPIPADVLLTTGQTSVDVTNMKLVKLKNTTGTTINLNNLSGGVVGTSVILYNSNSTSPLIIDDGGGNIALKNGLTSITIGRYECLVLNCVSTTATSGAWVQSE